MVDFFPLLSPWMSLTAFTHLQSQIPEDLRERITGNHQAPYEAILKAVVITLVPSVTGHVQGICMLRGMSAQELITESQNF